MKTRARGVVFGACFLFFACSASGQGSITYFGRVIEEENAPSPPPPLNPTVAYNCERAGDLGLAVGPTRIIYSSNCKIRLVDPSNPGTPMDEVFLRDNTDAGAGLLGLFSPSVTPDPPDPGSRVFDVRCHWDPRNQRFWIVAVEHVYHLRQDWFDFAWIHVAVSKTSTPNNLLSGAGDWYTYSFDMKDMSLFDETLVGLADRPTINTDGETLHIAIGRDLECVDPFWGCPIPPPATDHRTVLVALPTAQMLAGSTPAPPPGQTFFSLKLTGESAAMHCIARTYDALPVPATQYLIAPEMNWAEPGTLFRDKMLIGCLEPNGSGGWDYSSQVITLPHGATFYGPSGSAPNPQPPGTAQMGSQFFSAVFRGDSLWAVHNVVKKHRCARLSGSRYQRAKRGSLV